jgi:hypothetical protein
MWSSILGVFGGALKFFGGIIDWARKYLELGLVWWLAKKSAKAEALEKTVEIKDEQLKVAKRGPRSVDELLKRMRKRK